MTKKIRAGREGLLALLICIALTLVSTAGPAMGEDGLDPEAEEILRSMTRYLGGLGTFTTDADIDNEVLSTDGEKIHLSSSGKVAAEPPDKIYLSRHGGIADVELIFDGKLMTIHGKNLDAYLQVETPRTIDQALDAARIETGLDVSGGDLFYSDAYSGLMSGVVSSAYRGSGFVDGVECHHLAFRAKTHDWQIWIQTGDQPLPTKYVIVSKWMTAAPQYVARFRNWKTNPKIDSNQFKFTPSPGATKLDNLLVDEAGEFIQGEDK